MRWRGLVTMSMEHWRGRDAPVDNLMARSRLACSSQGRELPVPAESRPRFTAFRDREGFCPHSGDKILRDHEVPA